MNVQDNNRSCPQSAHYGRNIKRLREILGVKQGWIAAELNISQQAVSDLENRAQLGGEILEKIAKSLNINVNVITSFNEEAVVSAIINTADESALGGRGCNQSINGKIEKLIEGMERMFCAQQESNVLLCRMLERGENDEMNR